MSKRNRKVPRQFGWTNPSPSYARWISPKGKIYELDDDGSHCEAATKLLAKEASPNCSETAVQASANPDHWSDWRGCCAAFELLLRGWTRQRGCWFSVWKMNKRSVGRVWLPAHKLGCVDHDASLDSRLVVEEWNDTGRSRYETFDSPQEMLDRFDGLGRWVKKLRKAE